MRTMLRPLSELSDSREILEARPHPFVTMFVGIVGVLLLGAVIWSYYGELDLDVKAMGVVRPNEDVGTVRNKVVGRVDRIEFKPGQAVKAGDLLYTLQSDDIAVQRTAMEQDLQKQQSDLEELTHFRSLLREQGDQAPPAVSPSSVLTHPSAAQKLEFSYADNERTLRQAEQDLDNLQQLELAIQQGRDLFGSSNPEYSARYQDYVLKKQKLEGDLDKAQQSFKASSGNGDIRQGKTDLKQLQLAIDDYVNGYQMSLQSSIEDARKQRDEGLANRTKVLLDMNDAIESGTENVKSIQDKLKALDVSLQDYEVHAPQDGVVNLVTEIAPGDLLQTGTEVATIVPTDNAKYIVQLSLPNSDVGRIHVGDRIHFQFQALPYKDYGELSGTILSISPDAMTGSQGGGSFYVVKASLDNKPLFNRKGEEGDVKVGMVAQAHIVTGSEKILNYLLEKINLKE